MNKMIKAVDYEGKIVKDYTDFSQLHYCSLAINCSKNHEAKSHCEYLPANCQEYQGIKQRLGGRK